MNGNVHQRLREFDKRHIGRSKGTLSFVLIVTRMLKKSNFPASVEDFKTEKEGQVKGLGGAAIKKILNDHNITRVLSNEGGRTSRGNMGRLRPYLELLNEMYRDGSLDLELIEEFWIKQVKNYFDSQPFTFKLDPSKSLRYCIEHLMAQAAVRQREASGTMYVGAMMQHLVGAKLRTILPNKIECFGFSVADGPSNRPGDFLVGDVAIHVSTAPSESLIRKCVENLERGLKPLIVTVQDGIGGARALARQAAMEDRIDSVEFEQFLTANLYELSKFERDQRPVSVRSILDNYNQIISECETDPSLIIEFDD